MIESIVVAWVVWPAIIVCAGTALSVVAFLLPKSVKDLL